jgi:hypothetical protein
MRGFPPGGKPMASGTRGTTSDVQVTDLWQPTSALCGRRSARQITPPPNYFCGDYYSRTISIIPPRVWSSYNRPEQVAWVTQIERWNYVRREWYNYGAQFRTWSTFNWYGQSLTSWGHRFVNSKLNLPVSHPGYYRVGVSIGGTQGGVRWTGYIGGPNARCYMS